MKTNEELYKENYKGFASTSVSDAYKKGFMHGVDVANNENKVRILKIVDNCFHAFASSFRYEAKIMAERILDTIKK